MRSVNKGLLEPHAHTELEHREGLGFGFRGERQSLRKRGGVLGTLIQSTGMETLKLLLKVAEMQPLREGTIVQGSQETCVLGPC